MTRMNRDPRATVLDNRRLVESRLGTVVRGNRATLAAAAENDHLSGAVRADLALMADMVKELERGMVPTEQDAIAFDRAARRVVDALEAVQSRSWAARLDRCSARAGWAAMVVGGAGLTVAGVLFVAMFWVGPPTPAGYDAVMTGSFRLGIGGVLGMVSATLVRWFVLEASRGLRWPRRHPVRAGIWIIGVPLLGLVAYVIAGWGGVLSLALFAALLASWGRDSSDRLVQGQGSRSVRGWPSPDEDSGVLVTDERLTAVGAAKRGHLEMAEWQGLPICGDKF